MFNITKALSPALLLILAVSGCASTCPLKSSEKKGAAQSMTAPAKEVHYIAEESSSADGKKQFSPYKGNATGSDCKATKSAHNRVSFFPIVGPLFDLQTVPDTGSLLWWELPVSTLIPLAGPSIVRTLGSQICVK